MWRYVCSYQRRFTPRQNCGCLCCNGTTLLPPPRSAVSDTTILDFWCNNNQFGIKKGAVKALNAIDNKGDAGSDCFIVLAKTTWKVLKPSVFVNLCRFNSCQCNCTVLVYEVPGRGRFAGLEVTYPRAIDIWYGI